jgi:hypothetical protein
MEKDDKGLELRAIWELIDHLELRLEEIEEMMEDGPLSDDLLNEYKDKDKTINELLDKIDDYEID